MTSNQIANQANQEMARHNQVVEQETERHNKQSEAIDYIRAETEQNYKNTMARLTEEYNNLTIAITRADKANQADIRTRMANIEQMKVDAEIDYKRDMKSLQEQETANNIKYRDAMINIGKQQADTASLRVDYEKHKWDTENYLSFLNYGMQHKQLQELQRFHNQQYELGLMGIENASAQNLINRGYLDLENRKWDEALKEKTTSETQLNEARNRYMNWQKAEIVGNILNNNTKNLIQFLDVLSPF